MQPCTDFIVIQKKEKKKKLPIGQASQHFWSSSLFFSMFVFTAQRCSVIHTSDNVQLIGDAEEATFGNVVRFSCKSNSEILIGATEIYCNENGQWSGEAPECKGTVGLSTVKATTTRVFL